ncbi:MAG: cation-translocating P-type ATPase [Elusimicrobia bacterium]|nr:cation-translocating P-type ATPase [Elusimicrobiota bacterium]
MEMRTLRVPWHRTSAEEALAALGTGRAGLSPEEAARRLALDGPNALKESRRRGPGATLLAQFADVMVLLLLAAAATAAAIGEIHDAAAIAAILTLNALIGFVQERRAENAIAALKAMAAPEAVVRRGGVDRVVPAAELAVGDVVLLEAGAVVPADLRLLESARLAVDESALTGESVPVEKSAAAEPEEAAALGDRRNMAYAGTVATAGRGLGVVAAAGMDTEFGRVARLLERTEETQTPLQRRLAAFGRSLAVVVLGVCALVFAAGLLRGEAPLEVLLTAISLAVAAVPEALPAVVTISLALGALKMARRRALVRRLPAVETLGSVTCICSDKTGTLTQNRMRVEVLRADGGSALTRALALCGDAKRGISGDFVGDPTETALLAAALGAGADPDALAAELPRVAELPFDADRRLMTTVHRRADGSGVSFTKGAAEAVLAACVSTAGPAPFDREALRREADRLAGDGLRVLALASREWESPPTDPAAAEVESGLTFLGLAGLLDPPRPRAKEAVALCRAAGVRTVMITGDHPLTAAAVARRLGILEDGGAVMTGAELAETPLEDLRRRARKVRVYARVAPEQKLKIVTALQEDGEIVAMTGDGVNDAPALRRAEIGVAMGKGGTAAAREAAAMVLLDDDFATIVGAVREGRRLYDNIRRFVKYQLTTNSAEVLIVALAPLLGLPIPLLPAQILWVNLLTDGLPGLALAAEPEEADAMSRGPRPPGESVFARGLGVHAVWVGLLMTALVLGAQASLVGAGSAHWRTMLFTVVALSQLGHVLAIRSETESLFSQGLLSNKPLLAAVAGMLALQAAAVYAPPLQAVLRTRALSPGEAAAALALSCVVFLAVEAEKAVKRRYGRGISRK